LEISGGPDGRHRNVPESANDNRPDAGASPGWAFQHQPAAADPATDGGADVHIPADAGLWRSQGPPRLAMDSTHPVADARNFRRWSHCTNWLPRFSGQTSDTDLGRAPSGPGYRVGAGAQLICTGRCGGDSSVRDAVWSPEGRRPGYYRGD